MYENKRKPSYLTSFEITRTLYEILSPEIPMQVDTQKRGSTMPLVPFNYEAFDPERHSREDIDLYGLAVRGTCIIKRSGTVFFKDKGSWLFG